MGIALCVQTHGSLLNWQPHIHALVTDGGFRPDGSFVRLPAHATDALTEVLRRPVLRLFVAHELLEPEVIDKILKHLRSKGRDARAAGPWATGPPADAAAADAA